MAKDHVFLVSYNRPELLSRTLSALGQQTDTGWQITLVQDGPRNESDVAETSRIDRCVEVFRRSFPGGTILRHPKNLGVGLNFLAAQHLAFVEHGLDVAYFFEDDLLPDATYLAQLKLLGEALAPHRALAPYFACYGQIHRYAPTEEQLPGTGLRFMDFFWGYGLFRDHWFEEQKVLEPYYSYLRTTAYHRREEALVKGIFRDLGCEHPTTSQDGARIVALCHLQRCAVSTIPRRATYVGVEGEHSTPRSHADWGFANQPAAFFADALMPPVSQDKLQRACRDYPTWVAEMQQMPPNKVSSLQAALGERDQQIEELSTELSALRRQLHDMHESTSWQVTFPLRWLAEKTIRAIRQKDCDPEGRGN